MEDCSLISWQRGSIQWSLLYADLKKKIRVLLRGLIFRKYPPVRSPHHPDLRFSSTQQGEMDRARIRFLPAPTCYDFIRSINQPTNPTEPNNHCEAHWTSSENRFLHSRASVSLSPERSIQVQPSGLFPPSTMVIPVRRLPPPPAFPWELYLGPGTHTGNGTSSLLLSSMAGLMGKQRVSELPIKAKTPCPRPFSNSVGRGPYWCLAGPPLPPPPWCISRGCTAQNEQINSLRDVPATVPRMPH